MFHTLVHVLQNERERERGGEKEREIERWIAGEEVGAAPPPPSRLKLHVEKIHVLYEKK